MEKSQQWQELAQAIESQIGEIVDKADSHELGEMIIPWLTEVSMPNNRGQELLCTLMQDMARSENLNIDKAMRVAFMLGAAWQKACDKSAE